MRQTPACSPGRGGRRGGLALPAPRAAATGHFTTPLSAKSRNGVRLWDGGDYSPVDLGGLVEAIVLAPFTPVWLRELVASALARYGLGKLAVLPSLHGCSTRPVSRG